MGCVGFGRFLQFSSHPNLTYRKIIVIRINFRFLAHLTKYELLPSLGMGRLLTFHILIFSSKTPLPNELKLGRKYQI
jgi:hypothetical protein